MKTQPLNDFLINLINKVYNNTFYNNYKRILSNCNLPNYTLHTLRHTFASTCIEKGIDAKVLSVILGHSCVNTTLSLLDYVRKILNENK